MRYGIVTVLLLVASIIFITQSVAPKVQSITPSQYSSDTQVTYTVTVNGAETTMLSIDGAAGVEFAKTTSVTLDGSKPHQFQVLQVICQSGWECGDQVNDWRNGMRLNAAQWTWSVPAGTIETHTFTQTYYDYEFVCTSYSGSSCDSGYYVTVPYTQVYTQTIFTPPCKPCQFTFSYTSQYRLVIEDKHSSTSSWVYGWYDSCASVQLPGLNHPDTIEGSPGVRDAFNGWAIDDSSTTSTQVTMCSAHKATATYNTQYRLDLTTQCQVLQPTGGGWYNDGDAATIKVEQQAPMEGLLRQLGGKYVFNGWLGSPPIGTPSAQVVMHQPQTYTATCTADYTMPVVILIPAITVVYFIPVIFIDWFNWPRRANRRWRRPWWWLLWWRWVFGGGPPEFEIGGPQGNLPGAGGQGTRTGRGGQPPQPGTRTDLRGGQAQPTQQGKSDLRGTQSGQGGPQQGQRGQAAVRSGLRGQQTQPTPQPGTGQTGQLTQPTVQPGKQVTPSVQPGGGQAAPRIGPGQRPEIGPGQQAGASSSQPPRTAVPMPLLPPPRGWEFCAHCGEKIPVKSKYCPLCGLKQD